MSAKMATPGLFKVKTFWNKGYNVIISVHGVISKIFSRHNTSYILQKLIKEEMAVLPKLDILDYMKFYEGVF